MARVAVDIDDTLYSFAALARRVAAEAAVERDDKALQRLAYCAWSDWRSPADASGDMDVWGLIISKCHESKNIVKQQPFAGAADVLRKLSDRGTAITYISNRHPDSFVATKRWLEMHEFPLDDDNNLICTMESKHRYITNCQYIIDDRPKTLVEFVYDYHWQSTMRYTDLPRKGFGIWASHNQSLTDIPGIWLAPDWILLESYLAKEGVL